MTSVLQGTRPSSHEGAGDELHYIEHWFTSKGVPQFVSRYWPRESMNVLVFLLLIVVAFDLAIQPWVGLNAWSLLVAPAALICFVLIVKITILDQAYRASQLFYVLIWVRMRGYRRDRRGLRRALWEIGLWRRVWQKVRVYWKVWMQVLVRLTVLSTSLYVLFRLVISLDHTIYWANRPMAFLVIVGLLWISGRLFRRACWEGYEEKQERRRLRLCLVVAGAVLYFAYDGNPLPSSSILMNSIVGGVVPAAKPVPDALFAVVVTGIIMIQSRGVIRGPSEQGEAATQQFNQFFPAVPLLVLLLCAETTVLPYLDVDWAKLVVPLIALVVIVPLHVVYRWRPNVFRASRKSKVLKWLGRNPGLALFLTLYLILYPVMVGVLSASETDQFSIDAFGKPAAGWSAFLLAFGINLLYLMLAWVVAGFGLDRIAVWATREAWTNWRERISNLGRGLSLLLVVSTFLLLTAEVWESLTKITTNTYFLLVGAILVLTGAFHLLTSMHQLSRRCQFDQWSEVVAAAQASRGPKRKLQGKVDPSVDREIEELLSRAELVDLPVDREIKELLSRAGLVDLPVDREIEELLSRRELADLQSKPDPEAPDPEAPDHPLGKRERINAVMVMMIYEILFFIPVMLIAAVAFFALGHKVVPPKVAALWVYGDNAPSWRADQLAGLPILQQPWIRVAGLLAVFSVLYLAVEILSDPDKRKEFFEGTDNALRRRLAVRLAYREVLKR